MEYTAVSEMPVIGGKRQSNIFFDAIPGMDQAGPVPELQADTLTRDEFMGQWVAKNRACVIRGAVSHWPAIQKWSEEAYWLQACQNFELDIYTEQNFLDHNRRSTHRERMSFHDAIHRLFQKRDPVFSMPSERIQPGNRFDGILKDIDGFRFLPSPQPPRWYQQLRFFSYVNAATSWHFHNVDETLMCQVKGTKRVGLFSPHISRPAYVTKFLEKELYLDGNKLDAALDLQPLMTDVHQGDALYIPPYWHHAVVPVNGEVGFTVASCWRSPLHILGNPANYFVRRLYTDAMWPLGRNTFLLPLFGCYAAGSWLFNKLRGIA